MREERQIGLLMQRDAEVADPAAVDLHRTGTIANILRYVNAPDGTHHVVLQGEQRFRVTEFVKERPFIVARVLRIEEPGMLTPDIEARFLHLRQQALEALQLLPQVPQELVGTVQAAATPGTLADLVAAYLDVSADQKQELLETIDLTARLDKVSRLLAERIEVLRLTQEIGRQTRATLDERQREVILREQMAAIQRQLGEGDGRAQEVQELTEKIAKATMPPEVEEQARRELHRYERMPEGAMEAGMIRTYLDWLVELPWALPEEKPIDIAQARRILDEDHLGLRRSSNASSSTSPCVGSPRTARRRSCALLACPASVRLPLGSRLPAPWGGPSCGSASAASTTRRRSAPSADLCGRFAGQHHPGDQEGWRARLRDDAGRNRQDGTRRPGRSLRGHAGGARP